MLNNTDSFREVALHFKEFGRFTNAPVNAHPKSPYKIFWKEQARRCMEGYHAGHDYITGYHYFYLNFCPIWLLKYEKGKEGERIAGERINDFPAMWDGDYKFFHYIDEAEKCGEHSLVVKARGKGYSFKSASLGLRNYFLIPGSKSFYVAADKKFLVEDGILTKAWDMMSFIDESTAWAKKRQKKDAMLHKRASYIYNDGGNEIEKGYKSEIIGISVDKDVDVVRGRRGKLCVIEEGGTLGKITKLWNVLRSGMEQDKVTFGLILSMGTGGEDFEDLEGLEELFYYPESYNIHALTNTWDSNASNTSKCAFFHPGNLNYEGCYDVDGNSDYVRAKEFILADREHLQKTAKSNKVVLQRTAEIPLEPREAFLKQTATIFPVSELRERLSDLEVNHRKYRDSWWLGDFYVGADKRIMWRLDRDAVPLDSYPIREDKTDGCVVIYEMPYRVEGKVPPNLYIAGTDPYAQDEAANSDSVGSTFIMNMLTDKIVAEYTGRPKTAFMFYDRACKLIEFYNAVSNYENDIKGFYDYCYNNNCLYLLAETPEILLEREILAENVQRKYGTPGTTPIINWGLQLIKQYLLADNPVEKDMINVYKLPSTGLIKELLHWNPDGNFDRIRALGYLLILKQQNLKIIRSAGTKRPMSVERDPFWRRPFDKKIVTL